jgi:hypothetical protein
MMRGLTMTTMVGDPSLASAFLVVSILGTGGSPQG